MEGGDQTDNFFSFLYGFYEAVDWSEKWILGIGIYHLITIAIFILTRGNSTAQIVLWLISCNNYINSFFPPFLVNLKQ